MNDEYTLHSLVWRVEDLLARNLPSQYDNWEGFALLAAIREDLDFVSKAEVKSVNPIRGLPTKFGPSLVRTVWWVRSECLRVRKSGIPPYTNPVLERAIGALTALYKLMDQIDELKETEETAA